MSPDLRGAVLDRWQNSHPMSKKRIFAAVVILALASIGALFMFWKSKPKDSAIDERVFSFTLPVHWTRQPSSDPTRWTYGSDSGREQLTVSLLRTKQPMSADAQDKTLKEVTDVRRRAESAPPGASGVTLTDTTFTEVEGVPAARYDGIQSNAGRRFSCLLLCSSSAVTVFYYEALDMTEQEANSRAKAVFNLVRVPR